MWFLAQLEMQILRLHPGPNRSEALREGPAICVLERSLGYSDVFKSWITARTL